MDDGLITIDEWYRTKNSSIYKELYNYSDQWYRKHNSSLGRYKLKWVENPIRHCSRIVEYPFVLERILGSFPKDQNKYKILDAGSGITFFPYYLGNSGYKIECIDYDEELASTYLKINSSTDNPPYFSCLSLHNLNIIADESYDLVYSISVVEHILPEIWPNVVNELKRVLKPDGQLILTMDISIDKKSSISLDLLDNFFDVIHSCFKQKDTSPKISTLLSLYDQLASTEWFRKKYPNFLPWKVSFRNRIGLNRRFKQYTPFFSNLVFYCGTFRRI
jgi:SAM-dependent methyltransferase